MCGWLARDREGCTRHKDFPFQITEFLCNDSHWLLDKLRKRINNVVNLNSCIASNLDDSAYPDLIKATWCEHTAATRILSVVWEYPNLMCRTPSSNSANSWTPSSRWLEQPCYTGWLWHPTQWASLAPASSRWLVQLYQCYSDPGSRWLSQPWTRSSASQPSVPASLTTELGAR